MAAASYLIATLAFLGLAATILLRWRDRTSALWVAGASLASALWAGYLTVLAHTHGGQALLSAGVLELARNGAWFVVLLTLLASNAGTRHALPAAFRRWVAVVAGFLLLLLVPVAWPGLEAWQAVAMLALAIGGLVLVEQTYRNTPPQRRWEIKPLCLGLGGLFAFDLFLFADLALFGTLNSPSWQARGLANALVVPLLALSMARALPRQEGPTVSRHLLFHTATLVGAGLYLLAVASAGYYLRHFGGELGAALQVVFLFGAGLLLALVLFSGSFRARLKVLLTKHFFSYKYDYRQEWLRFTGTLSTEDVDMPFRQRAVLAIAEMVDSPGGLLWARGDDGAYTLDGVLNLGAPDHPPEEPEGELVAFLVRSGWVIDLDEYRNETGRYQGVALPGWLVDNPRHWLVIPLLKDDELVGFVVLSQPRAPRGIDWEDRDLLKTAGRQLAVYVALVQANEALLEARQFETFHRLAAFLVHDLKNVSAQLSLVCSNAERHKDNPEFVADAFRTIANARDRLDRTQAQLRKAQPRADAPLHPLSLRALLDEVMTHSQDLRPAPELRIKADSEVLGDHEGLLNVLLHLVRNAQEATPDEGWVRLTLYKDGPWAIIEVADNGCGMAEDFMQRRLFRPFQTTKGNAGMGIGVYEAREHIVRMGGRLEVASKPEQGTTFTVKLPARASGAAAVQAS
ncbi:XrtA/PEP-CTERM system histidine kinase PrsK [Alkalilimnicola ehrlichii MLHE-1]|uniref:histidine kinase n=1 Tax=Alkalilimnicola ehrlichii (strain ATCC BAA-1101 / DSM 17681 / MLHE-1) TaxID=187272 RepID=Q0ACC4_ALKEH|nr:XrtA/PEP-CTERM system histidine kinase PrsK [Alkalilimnicola ehrlichii]ABI55513.1 periplasmic sensor signal transduction histidine kinase [Alkalilimnicola ehrlichii MLHE-1]